VRSCAFKEGEPDTSGDGACRANQQDPREALSRYHTLNHCERPLPAQGRVVRRHLPARPGAHPSWGTPPRSSGDPVPLRHFAPCQHREFSTDRPGSSIAPNEVSTKRDFKRRVAMLWTIAVILLVLWALGLVTSYTAGGVIHLLLVIAIVVIVFQFISGRRSV
jgi:hypothetical protein